MAITFDSDRQYPMVAIVSFTYADLTDATAENLVELPSDAIITGGQLVIDTAFNSATSDTIAVGDTDTGAAYLSATSVASTGSTAIAGSGTELAAGKYVTITWDGTGTAPSAGAGRLIVEYIRNGRSNENQG